MMFSSPLIRIDRNHITQKDERYQMDLLDFKKEFERAIQGLKLTKNEIQVKKVCATADKFTLSLSESPVGMHFSGHGVQNKPEVIGM